MTNLIANIFTITVLSYWAGCAAYRFGQWLGWVTDPKQWPREFGALVFDVFRLDHGRSYWELIILSSITDQQVARETQKGAAK